MVITEERPLVPRRGRSRVLSVGCWLLVLPFVAFTVVRLFGLDRGFPLVQLLAFTPYVALASLVPLVVAGLTRRLWPAVAATVVVLVLAACVLPRWLSSSNPPGATGPELRVLTVNLLVGGASAADVVALVRAERVDLVAFQEYTPQARTALEQAGLRDTLPNQVAYPVPGVGGSALYSRFPLSDGGFRVHGSGFGQAMATLAVPGSAPIQVESVHPCAPSGPERSSCWRADLADQPPATANGPIRLLIGDFNATLDHSALRRLIGTGYRDAANVVGAGFTATWPYDEKWYIPGVAVDHVLADQRVAVRSVSAHRLPRADHRALFATLQLPPG